MRLHHIVTSFHLLQVIVDVKRNQHEKHFLFCYNMLLKDTTIGKIEYLFEKIYIFNFNRKYDNSNYHENCIELEKTLGENFSLRNFDKIDIYGAQYFFSQYVIKNKINFIFHEEGTGLLSEVVILENIVKELDPSQWKYAKAHGMFDGEHELVSKIICNMTAQEDGYSNDKAEHFDVVEALIRFDSKTQKEIMNIFTDTQIVPSFDSDVVFLTQHFTGLKILSFEEQVSIYQVVFDYFYAEKKVLIKPHPEDVMYYRKLFPDYPVIRERFPSEFLPLIFDQKPKEIATITSTGIRGLSTHFEEQTDFDTAFEKNFSSTHKYYVALAMLCPSANKLCYSGCNPKLVKNLSYHSDLEFSSSLVISCPQTIEILENCVYLIDDYDFEKRQDLINLMKSLPESSSILFLNSDKNYSFYAYEEKHLWNFILPIVIQKKRLKEVENYHCCKDDIFYLYSKNEEVRKMANEFSCEKNLEHSGISLHIEELTGDKLKIKALEGILAATEKRLLHYISLVEEKQ